MIAFSVSRLCIISMEDDNLGAKLSKNLSRSSEAAKNVTQTVNINREVFGASPFLRLFSSSDSQQPLTKTQNDYTFSPSNQCIFQHGISYLCFTS